MDHGTFLYIFTIPHPRSKVRREKNRNTKQAHETFTRNLDAPTKPPLTPPRPITRVAEAQPASTAHENRGGDNDVPTQ